MKYLNLDPDFAPYGPGIAHRCFTFSGGEPHIRIIDEMDSEEHLMITTRIRSFNDMGPLLLAVDALRRMECKHIELLIPYFPGARQDRLMMSGEPLTVKVYADLINALNLDRVHILDPHSDVTPALLNRVRVITNHQLVEHITRDFKEFYLISPDGGALKRVYNLARHLGGCPVVEGTKHRNVMTGELSHFGINEDNLEDKTCVVVDDICDGGGTFIGLAAELKRHNAGSLILIVTHGIFSRGAEELNKVYDKIYCTDSFQTLNDDHVGQIQLNNQLLNA